MADPKPIDLAAVKDNRVPLKAAPKQGSMTLPEGKTTWEVTPAADNLAKKYAKAKPTLDRTTVDAADGGWKNAVALPHVGNDKNVVRVTLGKNVISDWQLVTQRKIPLAVYHVGGAALTLWNQAFTKLEAAFDPVGVTFEQALVKVDGKDLVYKKGPNKSASLTADLKAQFFGGKALPKVPRGTLRVFVIERFCLLGDYEWSYDIHRDNALTQYTSAMEIFNDVFGPDIYETDPFISAKVVIAGKTTDVKSKVRRESSNSIKFDWDREWVNRNIPEYKIGKVHVNLDYVEDGFLGWSEGNLVVAATRDHASSSLDASLVAKIVIHELGHALGQVPKGKRRNLVDRKDEATTHYEGKGGKGPHCKTNAKVDSDKMIHEYGKGSLCVMYHDAKDSDVDTAFCASCSTDLRIADLRAAGKWRKTWK
jgi:hypothetical protein